MLNWDKLRIFYAVGSVGSLTKASDELKLSQSAISRQITTLEEDLGISLFSRHPRGLVMTEQGETLFRTATETYTKIKEVEMRLMDSKEKPSGSLTVTSTLEFGSLWLTEKISEFSKIYPDIEINLRLVEKDLDLTKRDADIAIRMHRPIQPNLIQRKLVTANFIICASGNYMRKNNVPNSVNNLKDHTIIALTTNSNISSDSIKAYKWFEELVFDNKNEKPQISLRVDSPLAMLKACEIGVGITCLPKFMVNNSKDVITILPGYKTPTIDIYLVYDQSVKTSKKVSVFREFLLTKVPAWKL